MRNKKEILLKCLVLLFVFIPVFIAGITLTSIPLIAEVPERTIFETPEESAEFPGGMPALMKYLARSIRYPENDAKENVQGRVIVKFIVEADGRISEPIIVKGVYPDIDDEALRVIRNMPKWTPAKNGGKTVATFFTLPVNFRLPSE